jgi:hypothetical protein
MVGTTIRMRSYEVGVEITKVVYRVVTESYSAVEWWWHCGFLVSQLAAGLVSFQQG